MSTGCPTCDGPFDRDGLCPSCSATLADETAVFEADMATRTGTHTPAGTRTSSARDRDYSGPKQIAGYTILGELGAGGMGAVYEAYEESMNRKVALKVLSRHHAPSEKSARRFEQEAWIAGKLDHPNIVKVYERGSWEELSYFSMELVDGGSLYDVIRNMKQWGKDERWGLEYGTREYVDWAIGQVIAAARALHHAHGKGVVHRDVKPMNLLLSRDLGAVKIADFGLAIEEEATRLTSAGNVLGTLLYMAPEQILGKGEAMDARTDVYALGVTLFELLTLEMPYVGKTQQVYMNAVLTTEARRARKLNDRISHDLEVVINKALEKSRHDRYTSAEELADDLENVIHFRPIKARATGALARATKWIRRKPIHAALLAVLIVGLPVIGFLTTRELQRQGDARAEIIETRLDEARWLEDRRRYREVVERADEVLALDGDNARALGHRAIARMELARQATDPARRQSMETAALEDVTRAVAAEASSSWPHAIRAHVLRGFGMNEEAEAAQAQALVLRGDEPTADELELDARLAMGGQDYARAVALLDRVIAERPGDAIAVTSRGQAYNELGEDDRAYLDFRVAVGLDPDSPLPYVDLGGLATVREEMAEAEEHLDRALELDPDSAIANAAFAFHWATRVEQAYVDGDLVAAREFARLAERSARDSIALDPGGFHGYLSLGASLSWRNVLSDAPDPNLLPEAMAVYRSMLERWPDLPTDRQALEAYGMAVSNFCDGLIRLDQLEEALAVCRRGIEVRPEFADAHYNLAGVHALRGHADAAIGELRRDVELGDRDWEYLMQDPWFESLHDHPGFRAVVAEMKKEAPRHR